MRTIAEQTGWTRPFPNQLASIEVAYRVTDVSFDLEPDFLAYAASRGTGYWANSLPEYQALLMAARPDPDALDALLPTDNRDTHRKIFATARGVLQDSWELFLTANLETTMSHNPSDFGIDPSAPLSDIPTDRLLDFYRAATGSLVTRFASRAAGEKQVGKLIHRYLESTKLAALASPEAAPVPDPAVVEVNPLPAPKKRRSNPEPKVEEPKAEVPATPQVQLTINATLADLCTQLGLAGTQARRALRKAGMHAPYTDLEACRKVLSKA